MEQPTLKDYIQQLKAADEMLTHGVIRLNYEWSHLDKRELQEKCVSLRNYCQKKIVPLLNHIIEKAGEK